MHPDRARLPGTIFEARSTANIAACGSASSGLLPPSILRVGEGGDPGPDRVSFARAAARPACGGSDAWSLRSWHGGSHTWTPLGGTETPGMLPGHCWESSGDVWWELQLVYKDGSLVCFVGDEIWTVRVASYLRYSLVSGLFHRNPQMPGHSTFAMKRRESSVTVNSSIGANPTSNYGFASVFAYSVMISVTGMAGKLPVI